MSDKLVWSNTMTQDYLCNLPEDSLRATLPDYGYESDMLDTLDYDGLKQLVMDDDYMWQQDAEEFAEIIVPEIEKQTTDGTVLLSGTAGRWDGNKGAGIACWAEDLVGGDIAQDCDNIAIYEDDKHNLYWVGSHHDGTHHMGLYALPDGEELKNFVMTCMGDAIDDQMDNYDIDEEEAIEDVINDLDLDYINNYCDFSKVPKVCPPIQANMNLHIEGPATPGEPIEVYKDESLEEAKSKNPKNLAMELQSIKDDYEDFGPDGFYAVPFSRFEKQYPEFTKSCIMTYLKELEILEPEELNDPEIFDEYWQSGELIIPEDWPILIDGATRLSTDRADKGYTWITLLKKYNKPYDAPDEADESLTEAKKFDLNKIHDIYDSIAVGKSMAKDLKPVIDWLNHTYNTDYILQAVDFHVNYYDDPKPSAIKLYYYKGKRAESNNIVSTATIRVSNEVVEDGSWLDVVENELDKTFIKKKAPQLGFSQANDYYESLQEAVDGLIVPAEIIDLGEYETYISGSSLQNYGFYQGDIILDNEYDSELVDKIRSAGLAEGDEVLVKLKEVDDGEFPYRVVDVALNTNESLQEGLIDELLEDEVVDEIQFPTQDNVLIINEPEVEAAPAVAPETNCVMEAATNVMAAYQNANKWLDIVKEFVYANLGCVFFSSYIHNLAHTMPARFDKFGDILHTVNMRIPYPATGYIPTEPTDIDSVFVNIFNILDCIKANLNDFIKCTDDQQHGMACAAEALLNDIEGEYPTLYKMQQEWANCGGDMATFDKYIGQFVEHKDELLA